MLHPDFLALLRAVCGLSLNKYAPPLQSFPHYILGYTTTLT